MGLQSRSWRVAFAWALFASASPLALAGASAHAQSTAETIRTFNIPAQPLAAALNDFAQQANVQMLFAYEHINGRDARAVIGEYSNQDALQRLLAGSGISAVFEENGAIRLAQSDARPSDSAQATQPELVVTGTRIRGAAPAGVQVLRIDRADIADSGRTTLQDVLQTLPQAFTGSQSELSQLNSPAPGRNLGFGASIDLRGLGADATLTLVNGRRLAPAGLGNFVDISAIPLIAVERVDILPDGASATYGADAVGGVVNIILRKDLQGAEIAARYGGGDGFDETGASGAFGVVWAKGALSMGYEYRQRSALAAVDRDYAANSDLRPFGGSDFSRTNANPGNILRVGATAVLYAIPAGQDGRALSEADLIPGQLNRQNTNEGNFLLPETESHALFASARQDLSPRLTLFGDLLASMREGHAERPQIATTIQVPATNYYRSNANLFPGQGPLTIGYFFGDDLGPLMIDTRTQSLSVALGASLDLVGDWRLETSVSYGAHRDENDATNTLDLAALAPALASSDPATAFNPFGDGSNSAPDALRGITSSQYVDTESDLTGLSLKLDGALLSLPAGALRVALGVEQRRESFEARQTRLSGLGVIAETLVQAPGKRTITAYFAEVFAPLLANAPLARALTLSMSVRREESSDFGVATTPKIGLHWAINPAFALRGSWGTSFRAPHFNQMLAGVSAQLGAVPPSIDPNATNGSTGLLQVLGANRDLKPEEAESWTAGLDLTPESLKGFRLSATYYDIDFANRIAAPGSLLDAFQRPALYPGYFIANPSPDQIAAYLALADRIVGAIPPDGVEVIWDERLTNLAALRVRGIDFSVRHAIDVRFGQVALFFNASYMLEYSRSANPTLPSDHLLDTIFNPVDLRLRAGASLSRQHWTAALSVNFTDDYRDTLSNPQRRIGEWVTYDARLAYRPFTDPNTAQISLDIRNLSDEDPPFANNALGVGFDTLNASPLGRTVMLQVSRRW